MKYNELNTAWPLLYRRARPQQEYLQQLNGFRRFAARPLLFATMGSWQWTFLDMRGAAAAAAAAASGSHCLQGCLYTSSCGVAR